jgi:hypothetical protein
MASQYSSPALDSFLSALTDQFAEWYPISVVTTLLRDLELFDIKTVTGRTEAAARLNSLIRSQPYSISDGSAGQQDIRFSTFLPAGTVTPKVAHVAAFCDGWPEVLTALRLACDLTTRMTNVTQVDNSNGSEVDQSKSTPDPRQSTGASNDAIVSYRRALNTARRLLNNRVGVHNYQTFEKKYALIWSAAEQPKEGPDHEESVLELKCKLLQARLDALSAVPEKPEAYRPPAIPSNGYSTKPSNSQ